MRTTAEEPFAQRVLRLPRLGVGISTEFDAGKTGLDIGALQRAHPELVRFLEIGADLERGVDADARRWVAAGLPVTYHFLDVNLEDPAGLDEAWMAQTAEAARSLNAAWLCGDAGLWHIGPRDRGHGTLMPPVLVPESAAAMAQNVKALRAATGFEVLPENPPAHVYLGHLHLCEYFAQVAEQADSGLLLDVAHLAIYQHAQGHDVLSGMDSLPFERIVEVHVAGSSSFEHESKTYLDDDHCVNVLAATWTLLEHVLERASNLRAIVFECERNTAREVLPALQRLAEVFA